MRALLPAVLCVALASCGSSSSANNEASGAAPPGKISLTSDAFAEGQPIPAQFTCDGADHSPALNWGETPAGTKSFALVVDDPDAPSGTFRHWGTVNIPSTVRSIATGQSVGTPAINDFGKPGYDGPCPPKGRGIHHYHFKLFALDVLLPGVAGDFKVANLEKEMREHTLERGELVGTYERK